jgi:hypothetical protein
MSNRPIDVTRDEDVAHDSARNIDGIKRYLVPPQDQSHVREGTPRFVEKIQLANFPPCSS